MVSIDNRLAVIASFVPHGSIPLDIGTDHGRLPVYLIMQNICNKVIASDISAPSLHKASHLVLKCNLADKVETRLGNGITVLSENEADTLIIAGMGGMELISILDSERGRWNEFCTFIFQPMSSQPEFREYLSENGFCIDDEEIAYEKGRYYEIMLVKRGGQKKLSALESIMGPVILQKQGANFPGYLQRKLKAAKRALDGVLASDNPGIRARGPYYENLLKEMGELTKCRASAKT